MTFAALFIAALLAIAVTELVDEHSRRQRLQNDLNRWQWPAKKE